MHRKIVLLAKARRIKIEAVLGIDTNVVLAGAGAQVDIHPPHPGIEFSASLAVFYAHLHVYYCNCPKMTYAQLEAFKEAHSAPKP